MGTLYKRVPATDQMMKDCRRTNKDSICNVLSKIYFATDDEFIRYQCKMAVTIAKAMSRKLSENKRDRERSGVAGRTEKA